MRKETLFLLVMLLSLVSCKFDGSADVKAKASLSSDAATSAPIEEKLFEEAQAKEGCTTEEDLEAQIEKAAQTEAPSLQGMTDPGCEVN